METPQRFMARAILVSTAKAWSVWSKDDTMTIYPTANIQAKRWAEVRCKGEQRKAKNCFSRESDVKEQAEIDGLTPTR